MMGRLTITEQDTVRFSEEVVKETKKLLQSACILYEIRHRLQRDGYVGESKNKNLVFLLGLSCHKNPQSVIGSGESAVGKSRIVITMIERYLSPDYLGNVISDFTGKFILVKEGYGREDSVRISNEGRYRPLKEKYSCIGTTTRIRSSKF